MMVDERVFYLLKLQSLDMRKEIKSQSHLKFMSEQSRKVFYTPLVVMQVLYSPLVFMLISYEDVEFIQVFPLFCFNYDII